VIVATATGGLGNYVYSLYNGSGVNFSTTVNTSCFTELVAGFYKCSEWKCFIVCDCIWEYQSLLQL
jgi:hypothetical protein